MTSYDTNAQVHRTFDLLEKHGGKCVYVGKFRKIFQYLLMFFGTYMFKMFKINSAIFHLIWRGLYCYLNRQSMFRCASSPDSIVMYKLFEGRSKSVLLFLNIFRGGNQGN